MKDINVKKAIITAAGYGTRFLPITKTIQKELLPILHTPIIDYTVNDCLKAGVEEIIFVIKKGDTLIRNYYSDNHELYKYLKRMNKLDKYDEIKDIHSKAKFTFIEQDMDGEYGTTIPLILAKDEVINEDAFLLFMGDDMVYYQDNNSIALDLINLFKKSESDAVMSCIEVPHEITFKYGIVQFEENNGFRFMKNIIEKPPLGTSPSNLANISKWLFTPNIYESAAKQVPDDIYHEMLITDTATDFAKNKKVTIYTPSGRYLDTGSVFGLLKANIIFAKNNPAFQKDLLEFIKEEFNLKEM